MDAHLLPSNQNENAVEASNVSSKRAIFLATFRRNQNWSLPDSIMYYITKKPSSSKCYQKLTSGCKYFFINKPILIVSKLLYDNKHNGWIARLNGKEYQFFNVSSKIWVTEILSVKYEATISSIVSQIYRYNELVLFYTDVPFKCFISLASKCERIRLYYNAVMGENKDVVALENLIEAIPHIKYFYYYLPNNASKIITSKTVTELLKIPHFSNIPEFWLVGIPQTFDIESAYDYIKKNKKSKIWLAFNDEISLAYKTRLQTIVNKILVAENRDYRPPYIYFPDNIHYSCNKLHNLYKKF